MDSKHIEKQIEALLFYKAEPMSIQALEKAINTSEDEIATALHSLEEILQERGIRLMRKDGKVQLVTAPETSALIETEQKNELSKQLGKAGLETLAIVLYRGPLTRSDIDYIRGVNSTFILRNLLVRGLIERVPNPQDQRSFLYRPTFDLLGHLGITTIEELPEFDTVKRELALFEQTLIEEEQEHEAATDTSN